MDKKTLTEEDIKLRFITPSITNAGWTNKLIRMEYYFTDGRVIFQGNVHALEILLRISGHQNQSAPKREKSRLFIT